MATANELTGYNELGDHWDQHSDKDWDMSSSEGKKNWSNWSENATDQGWENYANQTGTTVDQAKANVDTALNQTSTDSVNGGGTTSDSNTNTTTTNTSSGNTTNTSSENTANKLTGYDELGDHWDQHSDQNWDMSSLEGQANWSNWSENATEQGWQNYANQIGTSVSDAKNRVRTALGQTSSDDDNGLLGGGFESWKPNASNYQTTHVNTDVEEFEPTATVSGRLNSLLSQENPYIQQARQGAMEQANSRGLLNSSMAAGSGQRAAIESALPIAQQEAETANRYGLNEQSFNYNAAMKDAEAENAMTRALLQGDYNLANTGYQGEIEQGLNAQQHGFDLEMLDAETQANMDLRRLQGDIDARLEQIGADAETRSQVMTSIGKEHQQYSNDVMSIMTSPDLDADAKQSYIDSLNSNYERSINNTLALSGFDFEVFDTPENDSGGGNSGSDNSGSNNSGGNNSGGNNSGGGYSGGGYFENGDNPGFTGM